MKWNWNEKQIKYNNNDHSVNKTHTYMQPTMFTQNKYIVISVHIIMCIRCNVCLVEAKKKKICSDCHVHITCSLYIYVHRVPNYATTWKRNKNKNNDFKLQTTAGSRMYLKLSSEFRISFINQTWENQFCVWEM